ncbi:cytochrome P450 71A25-like [Silene latifolia]|uniref:cytochrome P450 71A25-like n=1 Tax=Silene latifolia TaxID=37657 RepID=UPI003D78144B
MLTFQDVLKLSVHPLFFLPLFTFIFLYLWLTTTTHTNNTNTPPSPPKLPFLGNLHQFDKLLHRSFHSFSRRYGDIMLVHIGSKPIIIISSAEAAQEIMKTHDTIFANRPNLRVARKILYDGKDIAFANYGEYWRQMKSICTLHLFSNTKVRSFRRVREEEASLMVEDIRKSIASNEEVINLSDYFIRITNDVVCKAAFGRKYTGEKGCPNLKELLNDFSEALGSFCLQDFIPWLGWIDYISGVERKADKVAKALDGFIESIVEEHSGRVELKGGSDDGQDLVEVLLQIQKENSSSLPKESIKAILLDMVAGGTDTTFTLLEWVMTELLMHPHAMKQLQDEVRHATQSKQHVDEDDLKDMKYLKSVIKETLRLHPPLPLLLPRESSQDTIIKGYNIPARTQVIINAWAIHRDPANWENPDEFRPERFLNSALDYKGQDLSYIPFGAGRRGCPGVLFAIMDAEFAVANLVHEFDWKLPAGEQTGMSSVAENAGTTVRRRDPLFAIPTPYRPLYNYIV